MLLCCTQTSVTASTWLIAQALWLLSQFTDMGICSAAGACSVAANSILALALLSLSRWDPGEPQSYTIHPALTNSEITRGSGRGLSAVWKGPFWISLRDLLWKTFKIIRSPVHVKRKQTPSVRGTYTYTGPWAFPAEPPSQGHWSLREWASKATHTVLTLTNCSLTSDTIQTAPIGIYNSYLQSGKKLSLMRIKFPSCWNFLKA